MNHLSARQRGIRADFDPLADFAHLFGDLLSHRDRSAWVGASEQLLLLGDAFGNGVVEQDFRHTDEGFVLRHEVGLAVERKQHAEGAVSAYAGEDCSFACFAVAAVRGDFLALLAEHFYSEFKIAVCLLEGFFAVHHARARLLAELVYV